MGSESVEKYGKGKKLLKPTLKQIFRTETPADWVLLKERKQKKKEEENKEPAKHAASDGKITAILSKSATSNYAGNFSYYVRGDGKARADKVYNEISSNVKRSRLVKFFSKYFKISSVNCNFNSKAKLKTDKKYSMSGSSKPYAWEAHHLIPGEAFSEMKATTGTPERIFNEQQYKLLLMSDYNVNNGNNMMALPSNNMSFFQPVHDLIQHPSNHNEYTKRVINEMKKVAEDLEDLTDDLEEPHPDVVVEIANEMKTLEDLLWDLLVKLGKAAVTSAVEGEGTGLNKEDELLIKNQSVDGTKYPMWALA